DEQRNSTSHCGLSLNRSTPAGTTIASPVENVTGAAPSLSITPQPAVATRHQTPRFTCLGRSNCHVCASLNLSTTKLGDVIRLTCVLPFSLCSRPGVTLPA